MDHEKSSPALSVCRSHQERGDPVASYAVARPDSSSYWGRSHEHVDLRRSEGGGLEARVMVGEEWGPWIGAHELRALLAALGAHGCAVPALPQARKRVTA